MGVKILENKETQRMAPGQLFPLRAYADSERGSWQARNLVVELSSTYGARGTKLNSGPAKESGLYLVQILSFGLMLWWAELED